MRTKEKCPKCQGKFRGNPLTCPECNTTPHRFFIDFPWKGRRLKLYSGPDGHPLDSWERAFRLLTTMRAKVDDGTFDSREYVGAAHASLKFEHYAKAWLERLVHRHERGEVSKGYVVETECVVRRHLVPHLGHLSIRDIHEGAVDDLAYQLPPGSITKKALGFLHRILADAHRRRDVARVPSFPKIPGNDPLVRWLSAEAQEAALAAARAFYRPLFLFLMRQGTRPSEAMALMWPDVDLKEGFVAIRAAMDRGVRRPTTKTRRERRLRLHPEVQAALRALPSRFAGGYVFARPSGQLPSYCCVARAWRMALKKAGLPSVTLYQGTKHSLASQAVNAGVSLEIIAAALGHRDSRSTRRYAKVDGEPIDKLWDNK